MNSLKNCSRKILVWWCGQLKRVTFFPVSSCQLHVRKREERKKKLLHCSFYVCVYFTIETKKRHLSCRRVGERAIVAGCSISTILVLYAVYWYIFCLKNCSVRFLTRSWFVIGVFSIHRFGFNFDSVLLEFSQLEQSYLFRDV